MTDTDGFGRFKGPVHILPLRIYYEDTDVSGFVYHANYLRFMERGRSEFFRCAGVTRLVMLDGEEPTAWTLRKAALEYLKPARVDDLIEVHTMATGVGGVRMTAEQKIYRGAQLLTHGFVEACIVTLDGKPRRIPRDVREKLTPFLCTTGA